MRSNEVGQRESLQQFDRLARDPTPGNSAIGGIFTVGTLGGLVGAALAGKIGRLIKPGPAILLGSVLRSIGMVLVPTASSSVRSQSQA